MDIHRLPDRDVMGVRRGDASVGVRQGPASDPKVPAGRARWFGIAFALLMLVAPPPVDAAKGVHVLALTGYKAVPVHYGPLNKMLIAVSINGNPANLIVDTGANQIILESSAAESFGVAPSPHGLLYVGSTQLNGELLPFGFVRSFTAGTMNLGSSWVALLNGNGPNRFSFASGMGNTHVAGVLGTDLLTRHKAVINCRTKFIFFKVNSSRQLQLANFAASQKFTRVPLRKEENGAFTLFHQWPNWLPPRGYRRIRHNL